MDRDTTIMEKEHVMTMETQLTTYEVANLLQCSPSTVNKWVDKGTLPGRRTPGGHRRVLLKDLMALIVEYKMHVPETLVQFAPRKEVLYVSDND